jgi:hypothetical protein
MSSTPTGRIYLGEGKSDDAIASESIHPPRRYLEYLFKRPSRKKK